MDTGDFSQITDQLTGNYVFPAVSFVVVIAIVIFFYRRKLKLGWLDLKTRYRLNRLGHKHILNFQCPDGLGYHFTIDRLILRHDGITLLVQKNYPGRIFCADDIDDWTQMLGQKSYRFKNPLYELECQIKAVSACVPGVPVNGFLFFDYQAEFPKGHPERIFQLEEMPQQLKQAKQHDVEPSLLTAWKTLQAMSKGKA